MHKLPMTYAKPQQKSSRNHPKVQRSMTKQSCLLPLQGREQVEFHEKYQYFCTVLFPPTGIAQISLTQHNLRVVFARTYAKNCLICQDCHNSPAMHDVLVAGQLSPHGHGTLCKGPQQRQWLSCCSHGCWYGFCATWQARDCRLARTSVDKDALFMTQIESMIRSRGTAILPPVSLKCFKSKARKAFQCVRDHRAMDDNPSLYVNLAHTYIQTHGVRRKKLGHGDDAESEPETEERIANTRKAISLYQKAKDLEPDDVSVSKLRWKMMKLNIFWRKASRIEAWVVEREGQRMKANDN